MEEEKDNKETSAREWEVVSLTASTYAAAPGPETFVSTDDNHDNEVERHEEEASRAMFMSGHFVFPPSQHENLPLVSDSDEVHNKSWGEVEGPDEKSELDVEEGDKSNKTSEDNWNVPGMEVADELHGIQFFNEKGKRMSVRASEFEGDKSLDGKSLVEEEKSIYDNPNISSYHGNSEISGSSLHEDLIIPEPSDPQKPTLDSPTDPSSTTSPTKEGKDKGSNLPCEAWWKRQAVSLFAQAKDANALWSVVVAAALMGLVILGQRWQTQQLKWQYVVKDEKMSRVLAPLNRIKDVILSGHRPGSIIRGSTSAEL